MLDTPAQPRTTPTSPSKGRGITQRGLAFSSESNLVPFPFHFPLCCGHITEYCGPVAFILSMYRGCNEPWCCSCRAYRTQHVW